MTSEPLTSICYAVKRESEKYADGFYYAHFFPSAFPTHLSDSTAMICKLNVTELKNQAPPDAYWAWWGAEDKTFKWVYPVKLLLEMVFPTGTAPEVERGRGQVCQVSLVELGFFTKAEAKAEDWRP